MKRNYTLTVNENDSEVFNFLLSGYKMNYFFFFLINLLRKLK